LSVPVQPRTRRMSRPGSGTAADSGIGPVPSPGDPPVRRRPRPPRAWTSAAARPGDGHLDADGAFLYLLEGPRADAVHALGRHR
jgi:hypothetical protein